MAGSGAMIDVLKRELKARGVTYAQVARHLGMSEAGVKRMFSQKNMTLKRIDAVCRAAGTEFSDLARTLSGDEALIAQLTPEQEKEIVASRKLFLVAVCALNHVTFEQIIGTYDISRTECIQLLAQLDRIGFIELQPNNRIKPLVSRNFSWLPDGPIQRFFNRQAHNEYFSSRFDRSGEFMVVVNGMLSQQSSAAIVARLKRIAREFSELHGDDVGLPRGERSPMSMLVAIRHWELHAFAEMRRNRGTPSPIRTTGVRPSGSSRVMGASRS
jgi:transcriptional regulator with XRE-family HTH domain